jgi:hypothetical protein
MMVNAFEVNVAFTNIIKSYLDQGFVISTRTANGSYSDAEMYVDMVKGDLKKGDPIYRIWKLISRNETVDEIPSKRSFEKHWDVINLVVKRYIFDGTSTYWPNYGDVISEKKFYIISHGKVVTDDVNDVVDVWKLRLQRWENSYNNNYLYGNEKYNPDHERYIKLENLPAKFVDSIMKRINKIRGFKKAKPSCIDSVKLYNYNEYNCLYGKSTFKLKAAVQFTFNGRRDTIILR